MNAVITGAAHGIGKACAIELAKTGMNLGLCDIDIVPLQKTSLFIQREYSAEVVFQEVDVADEQKVSTFIKYLENKLGNVDILINNAAFHPLHTIEEISSEEWERVLAVDLKGLFLFSKEVLPGMRKRKYGRIINIASEAGKNGGTICAVHYAAAKGGVLALTRNLAKQVGEDGITVNAIAPGRIVTEMTRAVSNEANQIFIEKSAVKRLGSPEDVANAVCFLSSTKSGFITGETINVNGGTLMD